MQQTLFALAAILSFSYYALTRHTTDAEVEHDAITTEIETAVADVVRARLLRTTRLAFDEQDVGRAGIRIDQVPTSVLGPDVGETGGLIDFDDVDDIDGWSQIVPVAVGSSTIRARLSARVGYVPVHAPDADFVSSATLAKRVEITATEQPDGPLRNRTPVTVTLKRVVTPTSL